MIKYYFIRNAGGALGKNDPRHTHTSTIWAQMIFIKYHIFVYCIHVMDIMSDRFVSFVLHLIVANYFSLVVASVYGLSYIGIR